VNSNRNLSSLGVGIATITTITVGIGGILDVVPLFEGEKWLQNIAPSIMLVLIINIAVYLVLERKTLDEIVTHLHSKVRLERGLERVYGESLAILKKETCDTLRISAFNLEGIPPSWYDALEEALKANSQLEIKRVVAINSPDDLEKVKKFLDRFAGYSNILVRAYVNTAFKGAHDYFISDDRLVGIGFPDREGVGGLTSCIWIEDDDVVARLTDWYNSRLWPQAQKVKNAYGVNTATMEQIQAQLDDPPVY